MDNYTIHFNVRLNKIGDRNVSMVKERLWRPLVSYHTHLLKKITMPKFLFDGLGLTLITTSAIIVEGVIADIIDEHCLNSGITSDWGTGLERATWRPKKDKYNALFTKQLESYIGYDAIDILFRFRNNVAHGLAHLEKSSIQEVTNQKSELESINVNYQLIRKFFIDRKMMQPTDTSSNTNHLWQFTNASHLWFEVKAFLTDVLKHNESSYIDGIRSEWETATSGKG
jgi:hypothetical protein